MKATPIIAVVATADEPEMKDQLAAMIVLLSEIATKMPLLHTAGRVLIDHSQTGSPSAYQPWLVNAVSSTGTGAVYYLSNIPWDLANSASERLYNQISVS